MCYLVFQPLHHTIRVLELWPEDKADDFSGCQMLLYITGGLNEESLSMVSPTPLLQKSPSELATDTTGVSYRRWLLSNWVSWHMPIILTPGRKLEDQNFITSLLHTKPCLKTVKSSSPKCLTSCGFSKEACKIICIHKHVYQSI